MGCSTTTTMALLCCLLFLAAQLPGDTAAITERTEDGQVLAGYVTVRPKAHMFWYFYRSPQQVSSLGKPWPTIFWMRADLGESSVGRGSFLEVGPLDVNLQQRNSTWLKKANLLFVDYPVGVGYSYVDDNRELAKTRSQVVSDLMQLLKALPVEIPTLQSSPMHLVGGLVSSYGGKMAAMVGVEMARAIKANSLNLTLGGVVFWDGAVV